MFTLFLSSSVVANSPLPCQPTLWLKLHWDTAGRGLRGKTQAPTMWFLLNLWSQWHQLPQDKMNHVTLLAYPAQRQSLDNSSKRHLVWTYPERIINIVNPIACQWIKCHLNQKNQLGPGQEIQNVSPKPCIVLKIRTHSKNINGLHSFTRATRKKYCRLCDKQKCPSAQLRRLEVQE